MSPPDPIFSMLSNLDPTPPEMSRSRLPWRAIAWAIASLPLIVPAVAMRLTDEVNWSAGDFVFAAVLVLAVGLPLDLAVRKSSDLAYRAGAALALGTAFLIVWINGAVGIIGSENDAVNLLFVAVLAVGVIGALAARFRPLGLSRALAATALAQAMVAVGALVAGWTTVETTPVEIVALWVFVALWAASASLFRVSARRQGVA